MNKYMTNLNRIEFIVTYDCTGRCVHCSEGDHKYTGVHIDALEAANAVKEVTQHYRIDSVMTFGGEALLYPESVYAIHSAAKNAGVLKRQLITNGFFSNDISKIRDVALMICESGVNDVLLSVDAFHQECIPDKPVRMFFEELCKLGVPLRLNPAWLVSREDKNHYNMITSGIVDDFVKAGAREGEGNVIFPVGNAAKYLDRYFDSEQEYINPYEEDPENIKSLSIEPDGGIFDKNIYRDNIMNIIKNYSPFKSE